MGGRDDTDARGSRPLSMFAAPLIIDSRQREVRNLRRRYGFVDFDEAEAFVEAYLAIDRYSTDHASFYEIRTDVLDGDIAAGLSFYDALRAAALRSGAADANLRAAEATRLKAQLLMAKDRPAGVALLEASVHATPEAMRTWLALGRAYCCAGEAERATVPLERAMSLAEAGNDATVMREACWRLADIARSARHYDQALHWAQRKLKWMHARLSARPADEQRRDEFADALADYGQHQAEANSLAAARPFLEQSLRLWDELAAREPGARLWYRIKAARAWRYATVGCLLAEEPAEAIEAGLAAIAILEQEDRAAPGQPAVQGETADILLLLSDAHRELNNLGYAMESARKATALRSLLFFRDDFAAGAGDAAAMADAHVARLHLQRSEFDAAESAFDRAIARWQRGTDPATAMNVDLFCWAFTLAQRATLRIEQDLAAFEEAERLMQTLADRGTLTDEQEALFTFIESVLAAPQLTPANDM